MKIRFVLTILSILLLSCSKDDPAATGKIVVFNAAQTEIKAKLEDTSGLAGETILPGQSLEFSGPMGQTARIEYSMVTANLSRFGVYSSPYSTPPTQYNFDILPGHFYLKVVNNTGTTYQHIRVENVANQEDYPIDIPANSTVNVDYFYSLADVQISVGTFADFYLHTYLRDVDFTIGTTVNQVVTITIN